MAEETHNIDDLVDYKDFESGLESNVDQDSFNDDIMKLYEDHKKKGTGEKTSEVQNSQRPMSKYQRNVVSGTKREEDVVASQISNDKQTITSNLEVNLENLLKRFNTHITKHKITKEEFMDNPKIYYYKDEFKELFKKIKFDISLTEIDILFSNNNITEEYILGQTFIKFLQDKVTWPSSNKKNESEDDSKLYGDFEVYKPNDMDINEEFKQMTNEIMDIVTKEAKRPKSIAKLQKRQILSGVDAVNQKGNKKNVRPLTNAVNNKNQIEINIKTKYTRANSSQKYLQQTLMKKKAEEEMIKLAIEKKKKENERDCIKKMTEANNIAEDLGINKTYSAYIDELDNTLSCKVFYKDTKKTVEIDLKDFLHDYKKLTKLAKVINFNFQQKETSNYYKESNEKKLVWSKSKDNLLAYGREVRQKKIKEVLIDSLVLKMKLKRQLKILRDKNLVSPSVVAANLKLINLDDDSIL